MPTFQRDHPKCTTHESVWEIEHHTRDMGAQLVFVHIGMMTSMMFVVAQRVGWKTVGVVWERGMVLLCFINTAKRHVFNFAICVRRILPGLV